MFIFVSSLYWERSACQASEVQKTCKNFKQIWRKDAVFNKCMYSSSPTLKPCTNQITQPTLPRTHTFTFTVDIIAISSLSGVAFFGFGCAAFAIWKKFQFVILLHALCTVFVLRDVMGVSVTGNCERFYKKSVIFCTFLFPHYIGNDQNVRHLKNKRTS